jgi:hypothetical protein
LVAIIAPAVTNVHTPHKSPRPLAILLMPPVGLSRLTAPHYQIINHDQLRKAEAMALRKESTLRITQTLDKPRLAPVLSLAHQMEGFGGGVMP